jgi:hypothetical protein
MNGFTQLLFRGAAGLSASLALSAHALTGPTNVVSSYSLRTSHTAPSDFDGVPGDGLGATHAALRYGIRVAASERYSYDLGVDYERWGFSGNTGAVPVPDQLQSVSLVLGNRWRFAEAWTLQLSVRPGLYSDFDDVSGQDVHVPGLALVSYELNPEWTLLFGVNVHAGREIPVLPAVGAVWRPDTNWTANLVLPRADVTRRLDENWSAFVGFDLVGGAYTVGERFGTAHGAPLLDGERLTYREIRLGAGARYQLGRRLRVELEGGWAVDRRFVYDRLDLEFEGDAAPYVRLGITGSY